MSEALSDPVLCAVVLLGLAALVLIVGLAIQASALRGERRAMWRDMADGNLSQGDRYAPPPAATPGPRVEWHTDEFPAVEKAPPAQPPAAAPSPRVEWHTDEFPAVEKPVADEPPTVEEPAVAEQPAPVKPPPEPAKQPPAPTPVVEAKPEPVEPPKVEPEPKQPVERKPQPVEPEENDWIPKVRRIPRVPEPAKRPEPLEKPKQVSKESSAEEPRPPAEQPRSTERLAKTNGSDSQRAPIVTARAVANNDRAREESRRWMDEFIARADAAEKSCERTEASLSRVAGLVTARPDPKA